ncbi:hypothetical protein IJJ53_00580 [Candidatus Saccharibacteria bacterium]|nr:hypothetical protein [Candidatus Saccharibacteria bacterium]
MKEKTKKRLAIAAAIIIALAAGIIMNFAGCSSCSRACVDIQSDLGGGLNRTINVYTANGDLLATYKGKIDLDSNEGGYVKFDFKGKRYIL